MNVINKNNKSLLQKFIDQIASIFSIKRKKNAEKDRKYKWPTPNFRRRKNSNKRYDATLE